MYRAFEQHRFLQIEWNLVLEVFFAFCESLTRAFLDASSHESCLLVAQRLCVVYDFFVAGYRIVAIALSVKFFTLFMLWFLFQENYKPALLRSWV